MPSLTCSKGNQRSIKGTCYTLYKIVCTCLWCVVYVHIYVCVLFICVAAGDQGQVSMKVRKTLPNLGYLPDPLLFRWETVLLCSRGCLELVIFLPHCWAYRCSPPYPTNVISFTGNYPQTHILKEHELDTILSLLYLLMISFGTPFYYLSSILYNLYF